MLILDFSDARWEFISNVASEIRHFDHPKIAHFGAAFGAKNEGGAKRVRHILGHKSYFLTNVIIISII